MKKTFLIMTTLFSFCIANASFAYSFQTNTTDGTSGQVTYDQLGMSKTGMVYQFDCNLAFKTTAPKVTVNISTNGGAENYQYICDTSDCTSWMGKFGGWTYDMSKSSQHTLSIHNVLASNPTIQWLIFDAHSSSEYSGTVDFTCTPTETNLSSKQNH